MPGSAPASTALLFNWRIEMGKHVTLRKEVDFEVMVYSAKIGGINVKFDLSADGDNDLLINIKIKDAIETIKSRLSENEIREAFEL